MKSSKKQILYRLGSLALALLLAIQLVPMPTAHAADTELKATIEEQIRAYADSIDQKNADDKAAAALAGRGISGGGKTFSVGERHALTATLFNSELLQTALTDTCTAAIQMMQQMNLASLPFVNGVWNYYGANSSYDAFVFESHYEYGNDAARAVTLDYTLISGRDFSDGGNDYDASLEWIAGSIWFSLTIDRGDVAEESVTYHVTCIIEDRFDFDTSQSSGFKKYMSALGAALFTEYNWKSTVSFDLTVPYHCNHSSGAYRWTYDTDTKTLTSDKSNGWTENGTTQLTYTASDGNTTHYHELDNAIRLYHDNPWVMEVDLQNCYALTLSPVKYSAARSYQSILFSQMYVRTWTMCWDYATDAFMEEYDLDSRTLYTQHWYGTSIANLYRYTKNKTYTYRLENVIKSDGSNMIWLSVLDAETGECLVEKLPMDDYYRRDSWVGETVLQSEDDDTLSGKDLYVAYIGTKSYRLNASHFELRVWENGEGNPGEKLGVLQGTENGVSTYLCPLCGGTYEESTYTPGDINGDGSVNNKDATRLFQHLSGWDVEVVEEALDVNGDGSANNKDATRLFQYLSGWDVSIC